MSKTNLRKDAKIIAQLIVKTDADNRGDLFLLVSEELVNEYQFATGSMIERLARQYGLTDGIS